MSKSIHNNNIVVNLSHVQHGRLVYVNQYGQALNFEPDFSTVRGDSISHNTLLAFPHPMYPGETELERAKRLNLLDVWVPHLYLKLAANSYLIYSGSKALSLWRAWKAKNYGGKK